MSAPRSSGTREPRAGDAPVAAGQPAPGPILEARGLSFGYERGRRVLHEVDLSLFPGRRLAVLGPNGGGKTTLFRLLVGLLEPGAGQVLFDGSPLRRSRRELTRLRESVQLVLQDSDDQLFATDVGQDVSFGPVNLGLGPAEVAGRVDAALAALGISGLRDRPTHQLSSGQRKRVAIAGAVALRPRLLILDEPTAGLDPEAVEELLATLAALHDSGTTLVLATHDVDLAHRWADELAVVNGTVRLGAPDAVLGDPELLAAARLGPAWAPSVYRLLAAVGSTVRPRSAAELRAVVDGLGLRS